MMKKSMQPEWETEHMICSYDVDPQLRARLPVLCRFMQEAAYHHAENLGLGYSDLLENNFAWVLARQRVEVSRLPKWNDVVKIRTWPSERDRLFFYRDFEITDSDGRLVLQARTAWFVIDLHSRERVGAGFYLTSELPEAGRPVFQSKPARLRSCQGGAAGAGFSVNYGDLDMNGHVNNVRYIEWLFNSLPIGFHRTHIIRSLEINYLAEAVYGDSVSICTATQEQTVLEQRIMAQGSEFLRARSDWKPC